MSWEETSFEKKDNGLLSSKKKTSATRTHYRNTKTRKNLQAIEVVKLIGGAAGVVVSNGPSVGKKTKRGKNKKTDVQINLIHRWGGHLPPFVGLLEKRRETEQREEGWGRMTGKNQS